MMFVAPIPVEEVDLARLIRPGDRVVVGQGTAEPLTLTRHLVASRDRLPACSVLVGALQSETFSVAATAGMRFESYGAVGRAAALARSGRLEILPYHYSVFSHALASGRMRADCVLVQLTENRDGSGYNMALGSDYLALAARHARLVIAEINDDLPRCDAAEWPADVPLHVAVRARYAPLEFLPPEPSETETTIARNVVDLIPDRAVLQLGVGSVPRAILASLRDHKDIGVHSGVLTDGMVDLAERGVLTNAYKELDAGVSVGGLLLGTRRLYDFADDNRAVQLRPPTYTHMLSSIARLSRFCAINSAVEVDLTGQVNAEVANGRYVGAIGGQLDFVRGANASPRGRAIIALPARTRAGRVSRIVSRVNTVTCPRSDVDAIVTEWGVAELRGCSLAERAKRIMAVAAPNHRDRLAGEWRAQQGSMHA